MRHHGFARCLGLLLLLLPLSGCLLAEQVGELPKDDISFHCHTGFNQGVVVARSLAIGIVAAWIAAATRNKQIALAVALPLGAIAAWLLASGYREVDGFRIAVTPEALLLGGGEAARTIAWDTVEEMRLHTKSDVDTLSLRYRGAEVNVPLGAPLGQAPAGFERMEQIERLELIVAGEPVVVDVARLSREQRHFLYQAIVQKASLERQG